MASDRLLALNVSMFLDRLASETPTPGGGATAGLAACLAAALGRMSAAYTLGRPKFAAVEARVRELADRLQRLDELLRPMIDEDAAAYAALRDALQLAKTDPSRPAAIEQAASAAGGAPLQVMAMTLQVWHALRELATLVNPHLVSDVRCGLHLAKAALRCAALNVRANLPLMAADRRAAVERELTALEGAIAP